MSRVIGITPGAFSGYFHSIAEHLEHKTISLVSREDVSLVDFVIFTGGADINPELYGQKNTHSYISAFSIARDRNELSILSDALDLKKKILGVCRGHQLINAAFGGVLIQEISLMSSHGGHHSLDEKEGIISNFFTRVNSMHHQGVLSPGVGLRPTSRHGGVIESTENENILTVQWHPEAMDKGSIDFFEYLFVDWS